MIIHKSIIHGKCPLNGNWDYYDVEIRTPIFIDVANLEAVFDSIRGTTKTQEEIADELRLKIAPPGIEIVLTGRHSQNTTTRIEL